MPTLRQRRIDEAITTAVAISIRSDWPAPTRTGKPLEVGDEILELDVITGQEDTDHWTRLESVLVEKRHVNRAMKIIAEEKTSDARRA